jgi:hypothetical protein
MTMRHTFFVFMLLGLWGHMRAQDTLRNTTLDEDVRSVQYHLAGLPLSMPVVNLNAPLGMLELEFDHLGTDVMDYEYTIVHCNSDWLPSELQDVEYINGFNEDRITDITNSFNTLQNYTHYRLGLPNTNMRFSKSGNYILKVWDAADDDRLVLTRRFMVSEPNVWSIKADFTRPSRASKLDTHQEIDFSVNVKGTRVGNPQNDVKAFILQNNRWDSRIGPIAPFVTRGDELVFDYQDRIVFPAGKEYRFFNIRSFDTRGEGVKNISNRPTYYEVTLKTDEALADRPFLYQRDANGGYIIANSNLNQSLLQCDYAEVLFSLAQNRPFEDEDVYVFGALSDWQLLPEYKMKYSDEARAYYCSAFLKQGYYNYKYMSVNRDTGQTDEETIEGNWHETTNTYTILVYFRPFGARFDRLVAVMGIDYAHK